jgi:hypothetical protein
MKNTAYSIFALFILGLLFIGSCSKPSRSEPDSMITSFDYINEVYFDSLFYRDSISRNDTIEAIIYVQGGNSHFENISVIQSVDTLTIRAYLHYISFVGFDDAHGPYIDTQYIPISFSSPGVWYIRYKRHVSDSTGTVPYSQQFVDRIWPIFIKN